MSECWRRTASWEDPGGDRVTGRTGLDGKWAWSAPLSVEDI